MGTVRTSSTRNEPACRHTYIHARPVMTHSPVPRNSGPPSIINCLVHQQIIHTSCHLSYPKTMFLLLLTMFPSMLKICSSMQSSGSCCPRPQTPLSSPNPHPLGTRLVSIIMLRHTHFLGIWSIAPCRSPCTHGRHVSCSCGPAGHALRPVARPSARPWILAFPSCLRQHSQSSCGQA